MLEVSNVNHHFANVQILHDLSFTLKQGEVLGFLGPNGAGKTTTMRILTGYLTPTSGEILFNGQDIRKNIIGLRKHLGYMPETMPLYPELTVTEYLMWAARIKQSNNPGAQVAEVLERCGLEHVKNKLIRHLSKGYQQRVGLAQSILGQTKLLILDEPTVGLDPGQIREIRSLIRELGQERTIILSTHILPEVELTCDRALIINNGRILAEDTPSNLVNRFGGRGRYLLRLDVPKTEETDVVAAYAKAGFITNAQAAPEFGSCSFILETEPGKDCRAKITELAFDNKWPVLEFKPADISLEDVFVKLVREETSQGVSA